MSVDVTESNVATQGVEVSSSGTGLLGMRERVEAHGGQLRVEINREGGLSLHAWMPVESRHEAVNA